MDRDLAVALIEQRRDSWLREDVEAYLSLFSEDFSFVVNGIEVVRGLPAVANAVRRSYLRYRPVSWEFHHIAVDGLHVLTEWTATMEERTTRVPRTVGAMCTCKLHDGLAIWQREYRSRPNG